MGFGWIPYLTPTMGGWAYLAGPVLGAATWLGVSRMAQALAGAGPGFISQFNQWGWMGTMVGFGLDLLIPGNQSWLPTALGIGFPIAGSILTLFGTSFYRHFVLRPGRNRHRYSRVGWLNRSRSPQAWRLGLL